MLNQSCFVWRRLKYTEILQSWPLISSRKIKDVFSHYLLSSTSEDFPIPLPCEVFSSMAGFFPYNFSTRFLLQPTWTQGDGATPRRTSLRWEAKDRLAQFHSTDVTLACNDQTSMETSARTFGLRLFSFENEELESDWTTTWSRTNRSRRWLGAMSYSTSIHYSLETTVEDVVPNLASPLGGRNRGHLVGRSSHFQTSEILKSKFNFVSLNFLSLLIVIFTFFHFCSFGTFIWSTRLV